MSTPNLHQSTTLADLARLVERVNVKSPELYTRAISGTTLVLTGAVSPTNDDLTTFAVRGSKPEPYAVNLSSPAAPCTCPDATRRGVQWNGKVFCKHTFAGLMYARLQALATERARRTRVIRLQPYRQARRSLRVAAGA
jgi:hypothetical protein